MKSGEIGRLRGEASRSCTFPTATLQVYGVASFDHAEDTNVEPPKTGLTRLPEFSQLASGHDDFAPMIVSNSFSRDPNGPPPEAVVSVEYGEPASLDQGYPPLLSAEEISPPYVLPELMYPRVQLTSAPAA